MQFWLLWFWSDPKLRIATEDEILRNLSFNAFRTEQKVLECILAGRGVDKDEIRELTLGSQIGRIRGKVINRFMRAMLPLKRSGELSFRFLSAHTLEPSDSEMHEHDNIEHWTFERERIERGIYTEESFWLPSSTEVWLEWERRVIAYMRMPEEHWGN